MSIEDVDGLDIDPIGGCRALAIVAVIAALCGAVVLATLILWGVL